MSTRLPLLSGGFFDFDKPWDSIYSVEDIANGLSRVYRFNGHVLFPITVAQHSVILSRNVSEELALAALLHDGSEAFLGDIVRSAKAYLDDYQRLEWRIMVDLFQRVGLDWESSAPGLKEADCALGDFEARFCNQVVWEGAPKAWHHDDCGEPFWNREFAKEEFLKRWNDLTFKPKHCILYRS